MTATALEDQYREALLHGSRPEIARLEQALDDEEQRKEKRLNTVEALIGAALWYAGQGLPVFPIRPGEKRPLTKHGFHDATTDAEQITAWWEATPAANIGAPTGITFDVIDVDGPTGYQSLIQLRENGHIPDLIGKSSTPRGCHLYIQPSGDGNTTNALPGIDYRGKGGYVLIPPSRVETGAYRWIHALTPRTTTA